MYKGFKTERAFYNCKLHGLAHIIAGAGADDFLKEEVNKLMNRRASQPATMFDDSTYGLAVTSGVRDLTDEEARALYIALVKVAQNVTANIKAAREITGAPGNGMSDDQRKCIIKISKYQFHWSAEVTFSKILEICPELAKRLTPWQIQNTKLGVLYNLLNTAQADKIIKRLIKIEKRNKENKEKELCR